MANQDEMCSDIPQGSNNGWRRRLRGMLILAMGCVALVAPFFAGTLALTLVGILLVTCGVLEMLETFHTIDEHRRRSAYLSGALSVLAGSLLIAQPKLVLRGLALFLALTFVIDGTGKIVAALRSRKAGSAWKLGLAVGIINCLLALILAARWPVSGRAIIEVLVAIRMLSAGWSIVRGRQEEFEPVPDKVQEAQHPDRRLGLPPHEEFSKIEALLASQEQGRRRIDAAWCWTFVLVFFAIHIGRMHVAWNLVGMISPLVAVLGDVGTAFLISFGIVLPYRLGCRKLTRPLERRGWTSLLARADQGRASGSLGWLYRHWLMGRFRFSRRMAGMRYSPRAALRWGLQVGLPLTAILIAVNPIWGFSWFFNSESWATEVWDRWAAERTDIWRDQMIQAVENRYQDAKPAGNRLFQVTPEGAAGKEDFSFLVLGDTGEGGAAQHSLRDQFLFLGQRPDVKFLVVSSDVIYPSGAMSDYESKFYLPFKGFTKPIYAIPGNHDWYDALEGFAANFLEENAARASMQARVVTDNRLTTTTETRIEDMIREAARLRREFGVKTGAQHGPFFEIQADRFALIAVDTGVLRRVENKQWQWIKGALERSKGKFTMVILGHPLYAGGRYQGDPDAVPAGEMAGEDNAPELLGNRLGPETTSFTAIHQLLREHQVQVVMAGDTHYFESYRESYEIGGTRSTMLHFVNGGGGAYMSIGTPIDWPRQPAVPDCGYFPRKHFLIEKLDRETPGWKKPLWLWVKYLRGWPLSAEAMAGAFIYSQAPYLQSFVEIRVEYSKDRVRLIPHGASGPLRWRDLDTFGAIIPVGKTGADAVEFVVPTSRRLP